MALEAWEVKLWHDDIRRPPDHTWLWVRTNEQAQAILCAPNLRVLEASFDCDLGLHNFDPDEEDADLRMGPDVGDGIELVKWLVGRSASIPPKVTIHSWNPEGARTMAAIIGRFYDASQVEVTVRPYERPRNAGADTTRA